jgi:ABC-type lipoprotein export system ATPase subunit
VTLGRTSPLSSPVSPLILCDNLVKIYKVADLEVVALQGLDLRVELGEMLGIVGPSGSGKTTLLNILGGLDRPSAGQVTVKGQDLLKLSDTALNRYRRAQVGFVWQQTARNLIPYLTVQENVELPMTVAGVGWREKRTRAQELLEAVGLSERRHHRLAELSGGEQQRAAIAVALANRPPLLLADEPTGEIDSVTAQTIFDAFRRLNRNYGLTTVVVSHDGGLAAWVDRVVAIRDGKTATEMVRGEDAEERGEVLYSEYVLLDSAGRLQIPGEYREQYGIGERVRLEPTDEGLLIRPVSERRTVAAPLLAGLEEEPPAPRRRGVRGLWARRRKG